MASTENNGQKFFSIIIATYNCGEKIEKTLQSIFSQDRDLFELIVVDGASSDSTLELLDRYSGRLKLISEKDDGIYSAFNKGIDLATGKYLYFIGAGDCLQPGVLAEVAGLLPPETPTLAYGRCFFVDANRFDSNGREFSVSDLAWTNICHQGEFYHRSIFEKAGKFESRYKVFADWMLNLRCFLDGRIHKQFLPIHIADFEGGGISADLDNDPDFKKDFPRIVRKKLGLKAYIKCKAKMLRPGSPYFYDGIGYAALYDLIFPAVQTFRRLGRSYKRLKS